MLNLCIFIRRQQREVPSIRSTSFQLPTTSTISIHNSSKIIRALSHSPKLFPMSNQSGLIHPHSRPSINLCGKGPPKTYLLTNTFHIKTMRKSRKYSIAPLTTLLSKSVMRVDPPSSLALCSRRQKISNVRLPTPSVWTVLWIVVLILP